MKVSSFSELPAEHACRACGDVKPIGEMVVIRTGSGTIYVRPRCKVCHNASERGRRREWKRAYLRRWRKRNPELTESYWRVNYDRERARRLGRLHFDRNHDALLIQGRLGRHGHKVSLQQARELLGRFGPAYPTPYGLSEEGRRECERIRSSMRRSGGKPLSALEVRLMVYEDGLFIRPQKQKRPYQAAAEKLRAWQAARRAA